LTVAWALPAVAVPMTGVGGTWAMLTSWSENCSRSMPRNVSVPSVPTVSVTVTTPGAKDRV